MELDLALIHFSFISFPKFLQWAYIFYNKDNKNNKH